MFCEKCGAKLEDGALFCTKCGAKIGEGVSQKQEKIEDNDIILTVKPKFKVLYMSFSWIIVFLFLCLMTVLPAVSAGVEVALGIFLVMLVLMMIIGGIVLLFKNMQYKKLTYDFYKSKVIFEDSFLNLAQKEVKYKYIREVTMRQSFVQRWFNIGNIVLYTNAETGIGNGISIINVENVHEVYKQIKEIVNV